MLDVCVCFSTMGAGALSLMRSERTDRAGRRVRRVTAGRWVEKGQARGAGRRGKMDKRSPKQPLCLSLRVLLIAHCTPSRSLLTIAIALHAWGTTTGSRPGRFNSI